MSRSAWRSRAGAWLLVALVLLVGLAGLRAQQQLDVQLLVALDAALVCVVAHLGLLWSGAVARVAPRPVPVRITRSVVVPRLPESDPTLPGNARPRAPGRLPH